MSRSRRMRRRTPDGLRGQPISLGKRVGACLIAFAMSVSSPAFAYTPGNPPVTLDTVYITASNINANINDDSTVPSWGAVLDSPYYARQTMFQDNYTEYQQWVASVKGSPYTSPDVRCNVLASDTTRQTVSTNPPSSQFDRWQAANQLYNMISNYDNMLSARALMRQNPTTVYNGKRAFTFKVTYADGGTELWVVNSEVSSMNLVDIPVGGTLVLGNGQVQSCPGLG